MKNTKFKKLSTFFCAVTLLFSVFASNLIWVAQPASANDLWDDQIGMGTDSGQVGDAYGEKGGADNVRDIRMVIANIIKVILGFIGIILVILIIWAGFLWMTASGNAEQVGKAQSTLSRSVIGLIIILAAFALATFIIDEIHSSVTGFVNIFFVNWL